MTVTLGNDLMGLYVSEIFSSSADYLWVIMVTEFTKD